MRALVSFIGQVYEVQVSKGGYEVTSSHGAVALGLQLLKRRLQQTTGAGADGLLGIGIVEVDEKEGHVVLPGDAAEAGEVGDGDQVVVAVLCIADLELPNVRHVVHVPAKDDGAEAKARLCDGQELVLRHQLAAQHAVNVDAGKLDLVVILEKVRERLDSDGVVMRRHGGGERGPELPMDFG